MVELKNLTAEQRARVLENIKNIVKSVEHSDNYEIVSDNEGCVISQKTATTDSNELEKLLTQSGFNVEKVESKDAKKLVRLVITRCKEKLTLMEGVTVTDTPPSSPRSVPCCTMQ